MKVESVELQKEALKKRPSELDKEMFLKILITQMKYQNPLQPIKPDDFLNQLSLITQAEQLSNIYGSVDKIRELLLQRGIYDLANLIGKKVNFNGEIITEGDEIHIRPEGEYEKIVIQLFNDLTGEKREVIVDKGDLPIFKYDGKEEVRVKVYGIKGKEQVPLKFDLMRIVRGINFEEGKAKLVFGCGRSMGIEEVKTVIS